MSELIRFTKMHGIGNDYIYVNCFDSEPADPERLAAAMSPRHFSVGADGLVLICRSEIADAKMRMFNLDGSEGRMCGNAIRCVGKYLRDNGIIRRSELEIETLSGVKHLWLYPGAHGLVESVRVDMGNASFEPASIPVARDREMIDESIEVAGALWRMSAVSMGNPHAVCFTDNIAALDLERIGPAFENQAIFPERVNTEFVETVSPSELHMRVWERGSGETFACGTGACAVVAAAVKCGICRAGEETRVLLTGGELKIVCTPGYRVFMTGAAKKIYDGEYVYEPEA